MKIGPSFNNSNIPYIILYKKDTWSKLTEDLQNIESNRFTISDSEERWMLNIQLRPNLVLPYYFFYKMFILLRFQYYKY